MKDIFMQNEYFYKTILTIIISLFLLSCNKENPSDHKTENSRTETESDDNDSDATLSDEEAFSSALVLGIMSEDEDPELQDYLEEQIYPIVSKSNKVTLDRISSSVYLLSYEENGVMKNYIIQKFYDPAADEMVFEKRETETNAVKQFVK